LAGDEKNHSTKGGAAPSGRKEKSVKAQRTSDKRGGNFTEKWDPREGNLSDATVKKEKGGGDRISSVYSRVGIMKKKARTEREKPVSKKGGKKGMLKKKINVINGNRLRKP